MTQDIGFSSIKTKIMKTRALQTSFVTDKENEKPVENKKPVNSKSQTDEVNTSTETIVLADPKPEIEKMVKDGSCSHFLEVGMVATLFLPSHTMSSPCTTATFLAELQKLGDHSMSLNMRVKLFLKKLNLTSRNMNKI